jgi:4-amino-4-deoxy-L-arabinose transferase-like glycosyltransferase
MFAVLLVSHFSLLRLPYYWDEAGYYIPAAWDFFRLGTLIPVSTLTNAHPPLPSIYLALWWRLFGFSPLVTRIATLAAAALALTAVERLAGRLLAVPALARWTLALTALYPVWFAQSSLAHADIFAAAATLWGLVYALPDRDRRPWAAALCFTAAVLCKETAIVIPMTLAAANLIEILTARDRALPGKRRQLFIEGLWLGSCALPLAGWYGWHYFKTGFLFGNPEFLRYNAQANLDAGRILAALFHRFLHLTMHMNLFVPVGIALVCLRWKTATEDRKVQLSRRTLHRVFLLILANLFFFSILGGALLTRYLLPVFPLVLLLALTVLYQRVTHWQRLAALSAVAFVAGLFINPWYGFAPEDNLSYARMVRMHQAGIAALNERYPQAKVLTAWPLSDELTRPELGYVTQPHEVAAIDDFTSAEIARAAHEPEKYSTALVFSTKIDPALHLPNFGKKYREADEHYFGLHHDLPAQTIAQDLSGTLLWQQEGHEQWIALIRFNRPLDAPAQSTTASR